MPICPFCLENECNTRDHIFPDFLGGHQKVDACECNSKFGYQFEARVNETLQPILVMLAKNGLNLRRSAVWQQAYCDPETGWKYDLTSESRGILKKPIINKDRNGRIEHLIYRNEDEVKKSLRRLKKKGKKFKITEAVTQVKTASISFNTTVINFDTDIRQLCVKMCIGLLAYMGEKPALVGTGTRDYLLGRPTALSPVRFSNIIYHRLESLRPPLAHVIYVEGNEDKGTLFGIIQFFGAMQFYVELNDKYKGKAFGYLGVLDIHSDNEMFKELVPLELGESPSRISLVESAQLGKTIVSKLNDQVCQAFGRNDFIMDCANDYVIIFSPNQQISAPLMLGHSGVSLSQLSVERPVSNCTSDHELISLTKILAENNFVVAIEGSKVFVSASLVNRKGEKIAEIVRNKLEYYSEGYVVYKNESENAFEVIDSNRRLLIQVVVDLDSIHFQGLICSRTGWAIGVYEYSDEVAIHVFSPEDEIPINMGNPMFAYG
ncbi:MAG: hypothetical protein ACFFCW_16035 [Candidatus Hodarchaeota archaeon]